MRKTPLNKTDGQTTDLSVKKTLNGAALNEAALNQTSLNETNLCETTSDETTSCKTILNETACKEAGLNVRKSYGASDMHTVSADKMTFDTSYQTKILLIRHGESLGNQKRIYLGHTDLDLSEKGYLQAQRTAELLCGEHIDEIYSSSLRRAYNTAIPHARLRGLTVHAEDGLREIFLGDWENIPLDILHTEYKEKFFGEWGDNFGIARPPRGESVPEAAERFLGRLYEIANQNIGKTILVAAHAAVIRASFAKASGIPAERVAKELPFPANASVSVLYFDGERFVPGEYSHASHLLELA